MQTGEGACGSEGERGRTCRNSCGVPVVVVHGVLGVAGRGGAGHLKRRHEGNERKRN